MLTDSVNQLMTTVFVEQPLASQGSAKNEQCQAVPGTLHSVGDWPWSIAYILQVFLFDGHGLFMWKVDLHNE